MFLKRPQDAQPRLLSHGRHRNLRGLPVSEPRVMTTEAVQQRLNRIDIDVRCCLAFNRALLHGLAAMSPRASRAIDAALVDAMVDIDLDDLQSCTIAHEVVSEARARLKTESNRLVLDLEQAIIDKAMGLSEEGRSAIVDDYVEDRRLRCG
jgi:hypothetical protein